MKSYGHDDIRWRPERQLKYRADENDAGVKRAAWRTSDGHSWYAIWGAAKALTFGGRHDANGEWFPGVLERKGYSRSIPDRNQIQKALFAPTSGSIPASTRFWYVLHFGGGAFRMAASLAETTFRRRRFPRMKPKSAGLQMADLHSTLKMAKLREMLVRCRDPAPTVGRPGIVEIEVAFMAAIAVGHLHQIVTIAGLYGTKARVFLKLFNGHGEIRSRLGGMLDGPDAGLPERSVREQFCITTKWGYLHGALGLLLDDLDVVEGIGCSSRFQRSIGLETKKHSTGPPSSPERNTDWAVA